MVTLDDVARVAGVERSTASKILNMVDSRGTTWVGGQTRAKFKPATCRRVRAAARKLGYKGGYKARWLAELTGLS